jgi:hypothetical protein
LQLEYSYRPQGSSNVKNLTNATLKGEEVNFLEEHALAAKITKAEALEPQTLKEAKASPDWLLWEKAIHEELAVLKAASTWKLVNAPSNANIVGSK